MIRPITRRNAARRWDIAVRAKSTRPGSRTPSASECDAARPAWSYSCSDCQRQGAGRRRRVRARRLSACERGAVEVLQYLAGTKPGRSRELRCGTRATTLRRRYKSTLDTPTGHECPGLPDFCKCIKPWRQVPCQPEPTRRSCRPSVGLHSLSQWLAASQQRK
jgi:hypothetical protein